MKMRRSFWTDCPRYVSRQEYNHYSTMLFGTVASGGVGAMLLISSVLGMTTWQANELADLPEMSIVEAINHQGGRTSPVKIPGYLLAPNPVSMPDEPSLKVLKGELTVSVKQRKQGASTSDVLYEWQDQVKAVVLATDSTLKSQTQHVPLDADLSQLPLHIDRHARARLTYESSSRTAKPIAVEYKDQTFPLSDPPPNRSVSPKVIRQYVPNGEPVTVIASVESGPGGGKIVAPPGLELQILKGSETDIRKTGATMRLMLGLTSFMLLGGSFYLGQKTARLRHSFVIRSN